jgi:hypothetical protein
MVFDALIASLRPLGDAAPRAAAIIITVELLSRPRVVVKCVTIVIRYVKSEARELWQALRELRYELTHWDSSTSATDPGIGSADRTQMGQGQR